MHHYTVFQRCSLFILAPLLALSATSALAVPSYARQTGMACQSCHTVFPELTAFGRSFKLNGYTLTGIKQITAAAGGNSTGLALNDIPPLSAMLQLGYTHLKKTEPGTQNDDVQFPQQLSFFFAGQIAPHTGSFMQITYDQASDKLNWDNTDIRYARQGTLAGISTVYGLTLNNAPTVQDVWNSTPVWGFPWAGSGSAPGPSSAALIDGALAQDSAGLGAYAMWNDHLYTEVSLYRSAHLGQTRPDTTSADTISRLAPYWRLAWQQYIGRAYLEVGTYGIYARLKPSGVDGRTDDFTDVAFDAQYELPVGDDLLSLHTTYINEKRDLNATFAAGGSDQASNDLQTFRFDGNYHFGNRFVATAGYFDTHGDRDRTLNAFSRNGQPDSNGYIIQGAFLPWQNVKFVAQYTGYNKFDGSSNNFDGSGRSASDNDTFYLLGWFMW